MMYVTRFKFDNEQQALNNMASLFGTDENGELVSASKNHSVNHIGVVSATQYDGEGNVVDVITFDGYHVNVVTREPLNATEFVVAPATPWVMIQGE